MVLLPNSYNNNGHASVSFSSSGQLQLTKTTQHIPLLQHAAFNRTITKTKKGPAGGPFASVAAIAVGGGAARPPNRLTRTEAHKRLHHLPAGKGFGRVSQTALVGAALQIVARAFTAVGLIMQRVAMDDDANVMLWRIGIGTYIASVGPDMLSYLLAPQAFLSVLSAVEPILVSVLAALLLPQDAARFTSQHSLATALCVAGILGCVFFGPGSWYTVQGAAHLLQPFGTQRFTIYLAIAAPMLVCLARQTQQDKMKAFVRCGGNPSQHSCLRLPFVAAVSLALQRLTLGMLGVSARAVQWQPWAMLGSTTVVLAALLAVGCMLCCAYHVCQGVSEAPPHIFVPLYCTMSALLQLGQSMVIMQEFRDEPAEKMLLTLACAALSVCGILALSTQPGPKASKFAGFAGKLPSSEQHTLNCLSPVSLRPEIMSSGGQ